MSFAKQPWSAVFMLCKSLRAAAKNDALCRFLNALVRIPLTYCIRQNGQAFSLVRFAWRRKRIRLIAERVSLLAKAKRQPRGRGFGGIAARNRRLRIITLPKQQKTRQYLSGFCGGGRGIRTPVGFHPNGFQDRLVMTASIFLHMI